MCENICNNTLQSVPTTLSNDAKEYICKLVGVNTYISQMKRDNKDFSYDNKYEFQQINNLKQQIEKDQIVIPSSCEKVFGSIGENLKQNKGFIDGLRNLTVKDSEINHKESPNKD